MRAIVISLPDRGDRRDAFDINALPADWSVEFVAAIPAHLAPAGWPAGPAAWGCQMSHLLALERALRDGTMEVAIFEDDAVFVPGFTAKVRQLFDLLPDDADAVMLGGQHMATPRPVQPGLVRCVMTHRTHAYVARGLGRRVLYDAALNTREHVDVAYGHAMRLLHAYAPDPFLVGQAAGYSDITGQHEPERFWSNT